MIPFLIVTAVAFAGTNPFCRADLERLPIPVQRSAHMDPRLLRSRIIRPGLLRTQTDLCRCLPRRKRHRPLRVRASLESEPNRGVLTIRYTVDGTMASIAKMAQCMGQPTLSFSPIAYTTDVVLADGSRGRFPAYPLLIELGDKGSPQR